MKKQKRTSNKYMQKRGKFLVKVISLLGIFSFQLILSPCLYGITLEEKLGKREVQEDTFADREVVNNNTANELEGKTAVVVKDKVIYKDPRLSCILSFMVPGMGEYYLRNDVKGTIFFLTTTSTYALSFYYLYTGLRGGSAGKNQLIIGSIGTVAALVLHIVGMVESYNDAVEINEARFYMTE
ncbi:MAG: hypothetical protein D6767_01225 [Candidatus Hydrogenedentota bacterium]|nr:MAG: hypothetical protein D6767_01225 [Candidatus Hydrogenedentota bacterium]